MKVVMRPRVKPRPLCRQSGTKGFFFRVWVCASVCSAFSSQKRVSGSPELELKPVISHVTWVLGTHFDPPQRQQGPSLHPWDLCHEGKSAIHFFISDI